MLGAANNLQNYFLSLYYIFILPYVEIEVENPINLILMIHSNFWGRRNVLMSPKSQKSRWPTFKNGKKLIFFKFSHIPQKSKTKMADIQNGRPMGRLFGQKWSKTYFLQIFSRAQKVQNQDGRH